LVLAPAAAAGPAEDYQAVRADYQPDNDITSCRFTRQQLQNAKNNTPPDVVVYEPNFTAEIDAEIRRHDTKGCQDVKGDRQAARLRISRIRPKGRESVTIRNAGTKAVGLRAYTLRDRSGNRIRLPRLKLKAGRSLRVFTECAPGGRRPVRRKARFFACKRDLVWDDRGDVVTIVHPRAGVVARRGYGRQG